MKNKASLYGQSGYLNGSLELFWGVELPSGVEHLNVAIALEAFPKVQRKKNCDQWDCSNWCPWLVAKELP